MKMERHSKIVHRKRCAPPKLSIRLLNFRTGISPCKLPKHGVNVQGWNVYPNGMC